MALSVSAVWTGATTDTTARIKARLGSAGSGTLLVADNEAMTGPVSFGPVASNSGNVLTFDITGLEPGTRYWVVVDDGALNPSFKANFLTHPAPAGERFSYIFGAAGDAGLTGEGYDGYITSGVSNSPVFDTMRVQADTEQWLWFSHLGDLHYKNIATNDPSLYRLAFFENMNYGAFVNPAARQSEFFRSIASTYVWDDHDFGPNNSDRTSAGRPAAQQVYREWVPHYTLPDAAGIHQSWRVGRILFIASDVRSFRDPNSDPQTPTKTMLGSAQKTWMENLLSTARDDGAEALVWQTPSRWVGGTDTWSDFAYERNDMVQMFGDTGWLDRMILMTADMHALSICSGPHNPYGRFPMFMFAGMDAGSWSTSVTDYDVGSVTGRRQYGTMRVTDNGHTIALAGTGYRDGTVMMSHTVYLQADSRVFALDYAAGHVSDPFEPTDDDQKLRNEITARRTDGGEYTYSKTTGPQNTGDPADDADAVGVYDEGVEVNVATDAQLPDQASWRVFLSTVDEDRYPVVRVDLAANPDLADELTGLTLGDRVTIANPPAWLAPGPIELIAEGGDEPIGHPNDWDMRLNASPGTPWLVAQIAASVADAGTNQPNRLDTTSSHLVNAVTSSATQFLVHTPPDGIVDRAPWIQSSGVSALYPTHFPFDLKLGGETVRCTACTPSVLDRFTRSVSNGWGSAEAGGAWSTSGGAASDYDVNGTVGRHSHTSRNVFRITSLNATPLTDVDVRVSVTIPVVPTGDALHAYILARADIGADTYYFARLTASTATPSTVQLTLRKRLPAETLLATAAHTLPHTAGQTYRVRLQAEGSTVRAKAWPAGGVEPVDWEVSATDTSITTAGAVGLRTLVPTANTNTLPIVFTFDDLEVFPQVMTVQRSVNGISKAQSAGTAISLAQPAPVPL
ncbi:alkaline phosphatase D family protein [Streptomyces ipomoeae]|uniref:alkaline phosphatase D family protein n=1 Tax=Streptomyces ipomoeae TaxID=103232 RepID=UPI0029B885A1|nr:alkaline phosphatase D family protein [Streptomyces ipomoeae]MDX2692965.1 alkaline phosphatase D family protein [Streptomyces ipomoeae]MDX2840697.1 alkaline phosphatase D family protein [Streptomyces ipomoeae]